MTTQKYLVSLEIASQRADLAQIEAVLRRKGHRSSQSVGNETRKGRIVPRTVWRCKSRKRESTTIETHVAGLKPTFRLIEQKRKLLPKDAEIVLRIGILFSNPMACVMISSFIVTSANSIGAGIEVSAYPVGATEPNRPL